MDLDTEVALETTGKPEELVSVKITKGTMTSHRKFERTQTYTVKNSDGEKKTVLVEQMLEPQWKLIAPEKPSEKTRDRYRFAVTAEPGKPAKLVVVEEQSVSQQWALTNLDDNTIAYYLKAKVVSDEVKQALTQIVEKRQAIEKAKRDLAVLQSQVTVIEQEQTRIRQNMQQLDRTSDLYARYIKKFGDQEDQVEQLRQQMVQADQRVARAQQDLDTFLIGLDVQ
jgi:hypothetical protein